MIPTNESVISRKIIGKIFFNRLSLAIPATAKIEKG
jgi:hypothetical protein